MTLSEYLSLVEKKIKLLSGVIVSITIQREIDINTNRGFIKGQIHFVDGSRLEFSEQLPVKRKKFRFHYMDAQNELIARWDSAPHHPELPTYPFHVHRPKGVEAHPPVTLLEVLDEIEFMLAKAQG